MTTVSGYPSLRPFSARLKTAKVELAAQNEFDHLIVNEDVASAAAEVVELSLSSAR